MSSDLSIGNLVTEMYGIYQIDTISDDIAYLSLVAVHQQAIGKDIPTHFKKSVKNLNLFKYNPPKYKVGNHIKARSGRYGTIRSVAYRSLSDFIYSIQYDDGRGGASGLRDFEL